MTTRRDRLILVSAVALIATIAALTVVTVLDAQRRGREALERQKVEQVQQLAASMGRRLTQQIEGFAAGVGQRSFTLEAGSTSDQTALESIQEGLPPGGLVLVDAAGRVTNGTLLLDPEVVGEPFDRPGLDGLLVAGRGPELLPVAAGLTTREPNVALVVPVLDGTGTVRGALLYESVTSEESSFNEEVSELGGPGGGEFFFVDALGTVIASTDSEQIGSTVNERGIVSDGAGFSHIDGDAVATADMPALGWRAVFRQDASDFEGGLGQQVQIAVLLVIVAGAVAAIVGAVALTGRLRAAREEQRRLAEINDVREEFIGIVSHELRTPVAGVIGFLQTTLDHWDQLGESERRETVQRAASNARRLQTLTRDVLDVSSAEQGRIRYAFGPVDLTDEVAASVDAMREAQPEREIIFHPVQEQIWVDADGDRLMQVLLNLFDNAAASSPAGAPIEVLVEVEGSEVVVSVADQGAGLTSGELDAVFDKFVRGRSSGVRGTGLGLYLCRQIVDAHGGRIWAEPGTTRGAVLRFALPLRHSPGGPPDEPAQPAEPATP